MTTISKEGVYHFDKKGTLEKPLVIGRMVRFLLGLSCLYFIYELIIYGDGVIYSLNYNAMTWFAVIVAFYVVNHVVSIGFGKKWGRKPQIILILLSAGLIIFSLFTEGQVLGTSFVYFLYAFLFYLYLHLGTSMILSSIIGTPGCEMRSIPQLYTILTGKQTKEHYCPGFLDNIDGWEMKRFGKTKTGVDIQ